VPSRVSTFPRGNFTLMWTAVWLGIVETATVCFCPAVTVECARRSFRKSGTGGAIAVTEKSSAAEVRIAR
jgi:hypothetical protein